MASDAEHLSMCTFIIHISSLVKCLFRSFTHFLIELFVFMWLSFFLCFQCKSFIRYVIWKIFLPVFRFFSFSCRVFCIAKAFIFGEIQFVNSSFMVSCPRICFLILGYRIFFPVFSSKHSIVLSFTFRLMFHLIFFYKMWFREIEIFRLCGEWDRVVHSVLLASTWPKFLIPFVEKITFPLSKIS